MPWETSSRLQQSPSSWTAGKPNRLLDVIKWMWMRKQMWRPAKMSPVAQKSAFRPYPAASATHIAADTPELASISFRRDTVREGCTMVTTATGKVSLHAAARHFVWWCGAMGNKQWQCQEGQDVLCRQHSSVLMLPEPLTAHGTVWRRLLLRQVGQCPLPLDDGATLHPSG